MLVLSRRANDTLVIAQGKIAVTVLGIQGGRVRLGISAPEDVSIRREEIEPSPASAVAVFQNLQTAMQVDP